MVDRQLAVAPWPRSGSRPPRAGSRRPAGLRMASAAQVPVARAWPMPSPVMGSVAAAASPTNRTRPSTSTTVVERGRDGPGPVRRLGLGVGTEQRADVGSGQQLGPEGRFMSWVVTARRGGCRTRCWPRRPATGNDQK